MFGSKNPFNLKPQQNVLREFDSAAADISTSVTALTSSIREELSFIEHVRETALHIVSDLVDAVTDNTLDEGELPTDRLDALILDAIDGDDEDQTFEDALVASIDDALSSFGVDDSVITEIFSDNVEAADAAIEAAANTVIANMPDDGDPMDEFVREFIYGEPDEEDGFDSAGGKKKLSRGQMSVKRVGGRKVRYKAIAAIRNGVKKIVNKRLPGQKIRLSSEQKAGLKKANLRSRSANAIRLRIKSLKKGKKIGLYK
ncbi:hypothetical protein AWW72_15455 [Acinetobacter sp. NRRL B-65365]|uniref:hypothetical protein n=1 Tax=Acinetobacter sp. NRRL B-65365 TaxID=1785092 RepID=UPI0007A09026|nr:hypothetical protein [Acinetobacter sp. NRRL B-65365]KYQ83144.1 hypothetical protein AWW72_15455 [Acinetobacter sp. NRRL B-65365]